MQKTAFSATMQQQSTFLKSLDNEGLQRAKRHAGIDNLLLAVQKAPKFMRTAKMKSVRAVNTEIKRRELAS